MKVATRDKVTKFFEVSDDEERALVEAIAHVGRGHRPHGESALRQSFPRRSECLVDRSQRVCARQPMIYEGQIQVDGEPRHLAKE